MQFIGIGDRILTENFVIGYLYTITFKTGIYSNSACIGIGDNFVMFQRGEPDLLFNLNINTADEVDTIELYDSGGGTNDYDDLVNRPQINSHTLTGNMSGADLGLQNTISDLDTIRAGAAAGATAVQPAELSDYQPVISDLDTIRAGAGAGATAVQPADMTSALAAKQDALSTAQLAAVNSGVTSTDVEQIETNKNNISTLNQYGGGKNKFNIDTATISAADASYTKNSDGTINVTKSTNTVGQVAMTQAFLGESGTYIISGCPSGGSSTTYEMLIQSGNTVLAREYGEGASVSLTKGTEYQFKVVIRESQTLSNKLFKPMISVEGGDYQSYAMSNAELTTKELQNKMSFGFSGNPNPAVYVKDWDFVPDGTYLLSYICSQDASTRKGVSVYMFSKYTTNHIILFTPVVEASGAIITSCVASGSEGAETITFTMAQRGYHTAAAIQIQAF